MDHVTQPGTNGHGGHEEREANLSFIVWSAGGLAVATLLIMGFVIIMFKVFNVAEEKLRPRIPAMAAPSMQAPEPRLPPCTPLAQGNCVVEPDLELQQLRAHEDEVLSGYGWQDQKNGLVHIPIDKAMDAVLQKGLYGGKIAPPTPVKGAPK